MKTCSDSFISVYTKKSRDRETASRKFDKFSKQLMQGGEVTPELALRVLRSYRLKILHEFCSNILDEVYVDSMKVQTLQTCVQLRLRASLLPPQKTEQLFEIGKGPVMENMSAYAVAQLISDEIGERSSVQVNDILGGQIINDSLFYVPHSAEVISTDRHDTEVKSEQQ